MEILESTIRAYQGILPGFKFTKPESLSEEFAQKRYLKKMEVPSSSRNSDRKEACWLSFLRNDERLPHEIVLPSPEWYKARHECHKAFKGRIFRPVFDGFGPGSSFEPTRGQNSVEARLASNKWSCTKDAFEQFAHIVYHTAALKKAYRKRYDRWFRKGSFRESMREADVLLYKTYASTHTSKRDISWNIFLWKLERVTTFVEGSRFTSIPKNNEKDRPINIEPFGNLLVQRSIGTYIRATLREYFKVDLDFQQDYHRAMIKYRVSTIDLSDASDSVSIALCKFFLPEWLFRELMQARSPFLLGKDKVYHNLKKISSMGNGFTFELMTLILLSLCRVLDPDASVFGDDIIVSNTVANRVVELLAEVGFQVNLSKTFINSPFRESCGANYHEDEGYIDSFDFKYPVDIMDCVHIHNKAYYLGLKYPSFNLLWKTLYRSTPKPLRGGPVSFIPPGTFENKPRADWAVTSPRGVDLVNYFIDPSPKKPTSVRNKAKIERVAKNWQYPVDSIYSFIGFSWKPKLRSPSRVMLHPRRHWAKYLMYLHGCRRVDDIITSDGGWAKVTYLEVGGAVYRASSLLSMEL